MNKPSLCFPFCSDLGNKEIYYLDSSWQPTWQLYTINHPNWIEKLTDDMADLFSGGRRHEVDFYGHGSEVRFPANIFKIEKYSDFWTGINKKEIILFLAPEDFYTGGSLFGVGTESSINFYEKTYPNCRLDLTQEDTTTDPPRRIDPRLIQEINQTFTKYKHVGNHSTFQFLFCYNVLFPANLRYLDCWDENGKWKGYINYHLKVKATPSGTYYTFISNSIFCQWVVNIKQKVPSAQTLKAFLKAVEITVKVVSAFTGMAAVGAGTVGAAEGAEIATSKTGDLINAGQQNEPLSQDTQNVNLGKNGWGKVSDTVLPNMTGQSDQVSYTFSLFDFWSKLKDKSIWGKLIVSNNLINNLKHNNNASPINYPLNITFSKLGKILS